MKIVLRLVFLKEPHNILVILNVFCHNISQIVFATLPFIKVLQKYSYYDVSQTSVVLVFNYTYLRLFHDYF